MFSIEEIEENYNGLSDEQILRIAREESKGLREDVLEVLAAEIRFRKLPEELISWVQAGRDQFNTEESEVIKKAIKQLACPKCGSTERKLQAHKINMVVGMIILGRSSTIHKVLCPRCGRNEKLLAIATTTVAGWWSRSTLLITPYRIIKDSFNLIPSRAEKISEELYSQIIEEATGYLRTQGHEPEILQQFIAKNNEQKDGYSIGSQL